LRIDYNLKDKFDFGLVFPVILLFILGLTAIYSATFNNAIAQDNFQKQLVWGIAALIIFFITYSIPTNIFKQITIPSYFISIFLLIGVFLIGKSISGAKSWLTIGSFGFQPSE
jgi:cell division protein FtsW (lipid II flippase)